MTSSHRSPRIETAPEALDLTHLVPIANASAWVAMEAEPARIEARAAADALAVELGALKRTPTRTERTVQRRYRIVGIIGSDHSDRSSVIVADGSALARLSDVMLALGATSAHFPCSDIGDPCACHWTMQEDNEGACERCGLIIDSTYMLVTSLIEEVGRQRTTLANLAADHDDLHSLITRSVLPRIGGTIEVVPSKPRTGSPLDLLDTYAERVTNAATADVEALLRDAVGALYWPLKHGHVTPDRVAEVLAAAATARGRMERANALAVLGHALKNVRPR